MFERKILGVHGTWPTSKAIIEYDPPRGSRFSADRQKWWCVANTDEGLNLYLRWMVNRNLLNVTMAPGHGVHRPPHPAHISIIRGKNDIKFVPHDKLHRLWKKYQGMEVEFQYSLDVKVSDPKEGKGHYWFVEIHCPHMIEIRKELGLPHDWKLHLTFGREFDHG